MGTVALALALQVVGPVGIEFAVGVQGAELEDGFGCVDAQRVSACGCLPGGRFSSASAGCTFGAPGARQAIRDTTTGPDTLASCRVCPRSARRRQIPSGPVTCSSRGSPAARASR